MSFDYRGSKQKAEDSLGVTMERCDRPSHGSFPLSQTQGVEASRSPDGTNQKGRYEDSPYEKESSQASPSVSQTFDESTNAENSNGQKRGEGHHSQPNGYTDAIAIFNGERHNDFRNSDKDGIDNIDQQEKFVAGFPSDSVGGPQESSELGHSDLSPKVDEIKGHSTHTYNNHNNSRKQNEAQQDKRNDSPVANNDGDDGADSGYQGQTKNNGNEQKVIGVTLSERDTPFTQGEVLSHPGDTRIEQYEGATSDQGDLPEAQPEQDWNDHEQEAISSQMSRQGAMTRTKKLELAAQLEQQYGPDASTVEHEFPDGYTLRRLQQYGDLNREGDLMSHCWSRNFWLKPECMFRYQNYANMYPDHLNPESNNPNHPRDNQALIHPNPDYTAPLKGVMGRRPYMSLRDPDNLPVVSYWEGPNYDGGIAPRDMFARHNSAPTPEDVERIQHYYAHNRREGSVSNHYHPTTGQPCYCYYGSLKHKTASQHVRKLRNENRRYLRDEQGQQFLENIEKLVGDHPGLEGLVPWFADRYKAGQMWNDAQAANKRLVFAGHSFAPYVTDRRGPEQARELAKMRLDGYAPHFSNWWNARNHPTRQGVQPIGTDTWDIYRKVNRHRRDVEEKQRKQRLLEEGVGDDGTERKRWADNWHVKQLHTPEELEREGDAMNHCTGSDEQPYMRALDDGAISMYSLRDPEGWPHATWHFNPDHTLAHIQGRSGGPREDYNDRISQFNQENDLHNGPSVGDRFGHEYDEEEEEYYEEEEEYYDPEIYLPTPDTVSEYAEQYHPDAALYDLAANYGNLGENTEVWPGTPDWPMIAQNYMDRYGDIPGDSPQGESLEGQDPLYVQRQNINNQVRRDDRDAFHDSLEYQGHADDLRHELHNQYQQYASQPEENADYLPHMNKALTNFENWYNSPEASYYNRTPQPQVTEWNDVGQVQRQYVHPRLFVPNPETLPPYRQHGQPRLGPNIDQPNATDADYWYATTSPVDSAPEGNTGKPREPRSSHKEENRQPGTAAKRSPEGIVALNEEKESKKEGQPPASPLQEGFKSGGGPGHKPLEIDISEWHHDDQGDEKSREESQGDWHSHRLAADEPISDEYVRECLREAGVQGGPLVHDWAKNLLTMIHIDQPHGDDPHELAHEAADQALTISNQEAMKMFGELPELHDQAPDFASGEENTPFRLVQLHLYDIANNLAQQEIERIMPEPQAWNCPNCQQHPDDSLSYQQLRQDHAGDWRCPNCDSAWADTGEGPDFQEDDGVQRNDQGIQPSQLPSQLQQGTEQCPSCEGDGKSVYVTGQPCPICDGTGKLGPHLQ